MDPVNLRLVLYMYHSNTDVINQKRHHTVLDELGHNLSTTNLTNIMLSRKIPSYDNLWSLKPMQRAF